MQIKIVINLIQTKLIKQINKHSDLNCRYIVSDNQNKMSTTVLTVQDIVQKVLGSRLKIASKDKELLEKQRKKVNKSSYLKSDKTITHKQFIENYELQECNKKLSERLKSLSKKYEEQMQKYKRQQSTYEQIQKVKQKLQKISKQNHKLQGELDKVRLKSIKMANINSDQNTLTLNLHSASSKKSNPYKSKSKSPTKNHNNSLQQEQKASNAHTGSIQPFMINSQNNQKDHQELSHQNKSVQTNYDKELQNSLLKQLAQKKKYIQQLKAIARSQELFIEQYQNLNKKQWQLQNQNESKRRPNTNFQKTTTIDYKKTEYTEGKIVSKTKRIHRNDKNQLKDNKQRNTMRQEVSEFLYQENNINPIAGTIIKVKKRQGTSNKKQK